ncbi:MAG TPA: SAP domain-containing protein [Phycisphaerae bacterium]|nr:SAP domain-containing protein [Phycisphaerae bacterium]
MQDDMEATTDQQIETPGTPDPGTPERAATASGNPAATARLSQKAPPPEGWREMKHKALADLCRTAGLPDGGKRAELVKRLDQHWYGSSTQPVHGKTLCPYCKAPALCNGTRRMSETLLRRSYKCQGKRRHTFTLDEAVAGGR